MTGKAAPRRGPRIQRYALAGGLLLVAVATLIDITVKAGISLLVIAPLATATVGRWRDTAIVAGCAIAASIPLGLVGDKFTTTGHWIAVVAVASASGLALIGVRLRSRLIVSQRGVRAGLVLERRERVRFARLASSVTLLAHGTATGELLSKLAALPVPELADLCIVDTVDHDQRLRSAGISSIDETWSTRLREIRGRSPVMLSSNHPVAIAARTGEVQLLPVVDERVIASFDIAPEHGAAMLAIGYRSALVIPIGGAGGAMAVLSLLRISDPVPYDEFDRSTGVHLAGRIGLALENARLFNELHQTERRLDGTLANLAEAVTVRDRNGLVYANQAAAENLGFDSPAQLLSAPFPQMFMRFTAYGEDGEPFPPDRLPVFQVFAGQEPEPAVVRMVDRENGSERWTLTKASALRDESGEVVYAVNIVEDITEVKHAELSQRFLSSASKLLLSTQDVATTLEKVAWALVPEVADWSVIHMPDERGVLRHVAFAHREPGKRALGDRLAGFVPTDRSVIARVMRTGEPALVTEIPEGQIPGASTEEHSQLLREAGLTSLAVAPMIAGDEVVGVISFVTTGERRLGPWHLELLSELALRAGVAVENAQLHAAQSTIANTLQHSLLPPRLPTVPGLSVAARFRAAGVATEVGGDFYDLFPAADGWLVVVGDVTGKGPGAAATTSLARYTLRTAAMYESDPARVLERLNQALVGDPDRRQLCTAVVVGVTTDPPSGAAVVEIACAGHPPPYLLRPGDPPRIAGEPGTLLGAFEETTYRTRRYELEPHDALVLYTDGVTDARGDRERFGQERLAVTLAGLAGREADEIAGEIDAAILEFEEGPQRDDVALVVLRCTPDAHGDATVLGVGRAGDAAA